MSNIVDFGLESDPISLLGNKIGLTLSNLTFENLDTISLPVTLLKPTDESNVLDNMLNAGVPGLPLRLGFNISVDMLDDSLPNGVSHNELSVRTSVDTIELVTKIRAWMSASRLYRLTVRDLSAVECWLALMDLPTGEGDVAASSQKEAYRLEVEMMQIATSSLQMAVECTDSASCNNQGLLQLPNITKDLELSERINEVREGLDTAANELVESDIVHHLIDRFVLDRQEKCPSFAKQNASKVVRPIPPLPVLSTKALESLSATGLFAAQLSWAVLSVDEQYKAKRIKGSSSPLSMELSELQNAEELVDFTDLSNSLGGPVGWFFKGAQQYLGGFQVDPSFSDGSEMLGANIMARSLLDSEGRYSMEVNEKMVGDSNLGISVRTMKIRGLDSLNSVNIADAVGPHILRNTLVWKELDLEWELLVGSDSHEGSQISVTVSIGLSNVSTTFALLLAVDANSLGSIELGHLLETSSMLQCILSVPRKMKLRELDVSVGAIQYIKIRGFSDEKVASSSTTMAATLLEKYSNTLASSASSLISRVVKSMISEMVDRHGDNRTKESSCTRVGTGVPGAMIDFRDLFLLKAEALRLGASGIAPYGDLVSVLWNFVNKELASKDKETGRATINSWLIDPLTESQSGTAGELVFRGDFVNKFLRLDIIGATFKIRLYDAYIKNLDTFGTPLILLDPIEGESYVLNNTASMGVGEPLQLGTKLTIGLLAAGTSVVNTVDITVSAENADLALQVLLKVAEESVMRFPMRDIMNLDCWLTTLPLPTLDDHRVRTQNSEMPFDIQQLSKSFKELKLDINCVECSSPSLSAITQLLSTPKGIKDSQKAVEDMVDFFTDILGSDYLELELDRRLLKASSRCPHRPEYDPSAPEKQYAPFATHSTVDSFESLLALAIVAGGLLVVVAVIIFLVRIIVCRRQRRWLDSLSNQKVLRLCRLQQTMKERSNEVDKQMSSLFSSVDVPVWVRFAIPLIILGNIGLFLSGHLSPAASVSVIISIAGETIRTDDFFEFSIASGTVNIWNAGGKALALLILAFSVVWPYAKLPISMVLWFLPPRILRRSTRGTIFRWLDTLAKWSMIDVFTILICIVGFRVSAQSPDLAFLPADLYSLDLLVIPKLGLYANFIAQVVSQISSHFMIHYHDKSVREAERRLDNERAGLTAAGTSTRNGNAMSIGGHEQAPVSSAAPEHVEESLRRHAFSRLHRGESERLVARYFTTPFLLCFGAILCVLIVLGCLLPSFSLEWLGIIAVAVEAGQDFDEASVDLSLFNMMKVLVNQANFTSKTADYIGLVLFAALLLSTVMIAPLVQTALLLYHWLRPMTRTRRKRLIAANEILQAWQYTEVFALSILAGTWQLGSISDFMVNIYCDQAAAVKTFLGLLNFMGILDDEDAQCFRVSADVEKGFFLLAAAALLLASLNTFVDNASSQYLRDTDVPNRPAILLQKEDDQIEVEKAKLLIDPPSQLFTDRYRWFLVGGDSSVKHLLDSSSIPGSQESPTSGNIAEESVAQASSSASDLRSGDEDAFFEQNVSAIGF